MSTDRQSVQEALTAVDFPASKDSLIDHAENSNADKATIDALWAIPPEYYENVSQVVGAVPLDKGTEEEQSDSDKAQQHRHNTQSGLAEHQTQKPVNPIVEELGENRGS